MTTPEKVLEIERSFIGNHGGQLFQNWYGMRGAWCAMFQSYCFDAAGLTLPASSPKGFAWVSAGFHWMRNQGWNSYDIRSVQPGDLLAFEWGQTAGGYDHIGICESVRPDGMITIEGNVQNRVQRLFRSFASGGVREIARPPYQNLPTPVETKGTDNDMFKLTNRDGRQEMFALASDGRVLISWQPAVGKPYNAWSELKPGVLGSNLVAEVAKDGRLCVTVATAPYGALYGTWQSQPGQGPWIDWFNVNEFLAYVNGA